MQLLKFCCISVLLMAIAFPVFAQPSSSPPAAAVSAAGTASSSGKSNQGKIAKVQPVAKKAPTKQSSEFIPPPEPIAQDSGEMDLVAETSRDFFGHVSRSDPFDVKWLPSEGERGMYLFYLYLNPATMINCLKARGGDTREWKVMAGNTPENSKYAGRPIPGYQVNQYTVAFKFEPVGRWRMNFPIEWTTGDGEDCWVMIQPSVATVAGCNDNGYRFNFGENGDIRALPGNCGSD